MFQQQSPPVQISSLSIYIFLIILLAILGAVNVFLPQGVLATAPIEQQMPASKWVLALITAGMMLLIYGGLGFLGLRLAQKLNFPEFWDAAVSNVQRFLIPALIGVGIGLFFILADLVFQQMHSLDTLPHPPFPTSIVASAVAGIGEEVIFRLFFIPLWVWVISSLLLNGQWQEPVFWGVAIVSALIFALAHLPSVMPALGIESVNQIPSALMIEIILLNSMVALFAAYFFKQYGFLAAVSIHFWTDIVWHVIWGWFA
ncbi:CPBP family intramembrane metalloprotease [Chloroflexi bacterium TSY]|nr:CPBP family intramembrane metalloprotease [Chloroflexi bacterium TSY]